MKKRWVKRHAFFNGDNVAEQFKIPSAIARILATREIRPSQIRGFLEPDLKNLHSPLLLNDIEAAVYRLREAIVNGETIFIYGDYDVDGVTSLALLYRNLKRLGARNVIPYIPDRFVEGYGLSEKGIYEAKEQGATLIITVDSGITAVREVELASQLGIDVIVTDHHEPKDELPRALALVNPKLGKYPFKSLAGVGVTYKFLEAYYREFDVPENPLMWDLDLVALGTVADIVPLVDENRILTKFGLIVLEKTRKVGLIALKKIARLNGGPMQTWHISFVLGPRLNAMGRLSTAMKSLQLLITRDGAQAMELARELEVANRNRQSIERAIFKEAVEMVENEIDLEETRVLVLGKDGWHEGVIGIVASRLVDMYRRPVLLVSFKDGMGKGSARSIRSFPLHDALKMAEKHLESFGGHQFAAGFKVSEQKIDDLARELNKIAVEVLDSRVEELPELEYDTEVTLSELDREFMFYHDKLAPFGYGNPQPLMLVRGAEIVSKPKVVGTRHVKFAVNDETATRSVIFFDGIDRIEELWEGRVIDILFTMKGEDLKLVDFRESQPNHERS